MIAVIIYYSKSGNTAKLAKKIQNRFPAEMVEIKPKSAYGNYVSAVVRVGGENIRGKVPEYKAPDLDLTNVDTVFIGYPIWYSSAPSFVLDYIRTLDLKGKTVIPFSTSGASNIKVTLEKLKKAAKGANVVHPYNCGMFSKDDFEKWVKEVRG